MKQAQNETAVKHLVCPKTKCPYSLVTIPRVLSSGASVLPHVRLTGSRVNGCTSVYNYAQAHQCLAAVNAGIFNTTTLAPECALALGGKVLLDQPETYAHPATQGGNKRQELYMLGISASGNMATFAPNHSVQSIVSEGYQDVFMGFVPIVVGGKQFKQQDQICYYMCNVIKPRQIIGTYKNGNYFVLTVHSPGLTFKGCRALLKTLPVQFAFHLDGGKSTQTVVGKQQINPVYCPPTGRAVATIITFEAK